MIYALRLRCISQLGRVRRMREWRLTPVACAGVRSGKDSCLLKYASHASDLVSRHSNPE